jgi:serine/threonine-protein kinase HipA
MSDLDVLVFGERCGTIAATAGLGYAFDYEPSWRPGARHGISLCLPRDAPHGTSAARAYFGGLLPEGAARRHIAQARGLDELDDLAFLDAFGHDCPGAVQVLRHGERPPDSGSIAWLQDGSLAAFVEDLRVPGTDDPADRYSISLAGAQLKRGVVLDDATAAIGIPTGARLSTHIIKLAAAQLDGIVQNEHAIQLLAAATGLRASESRVLDVAGERVFASTRYDRHVSSDDTVHVAHQEDFCQALGRLSSHKYERFDPATSRAVGPGIADMVELLRATARPSVHHVDEILRTFWFHVLVGNVDAHAKNYSLVYGADLEDVRLAPVYDAICVMAHHAHESEATRYADEPLVMQVGGQTRFWQLTRADIDAHARELRIQPRYLRTRIERLAARVVEHAPIVLDACQSDDLTAHPVLDAVRSEIERRVEFIRTLVG